MVQSNVPRIEALEGRRDNLPVRVLVAGEKDYHHMVVEALASEEVALVDHVADVESLLNRLRGEEFDCLITDQTFGGRNSLELHEEIERDVADPPVMILLTAEDDAKAILKAFRNGVGDFVSTGHKFGRELTQAVRRAVERKRKTQLLQDEIQHLSHLARYDRLTGAPNRNFLTTALPRWSPARSAITASSPSSSST